MKVKDAKLRDENFSAPKIGIGTKFYIDGYSHDTDDIYIITEDYCPDCVRVINMQTGLRIGEIVEVVNPYYLSLDEIKSIVVLDVDRLEIVDVAIKLTDVSL